MTKEQIILVAIAIIVPGGTLLVAAYKLLRKGSK